MDGFLAATRIAVVQHVVVHERRRVNHLRNLRQPSLSIRNIAHMHQFRRRTRDEKHQDRSQPLPSSAKNLIRRRQEERILPSDDIPQIQAQLFHILRHRRRDLRDVVSFPLITRSERRVMLRIELIERRRHSSPHRRPALILRRIRRHRASPRASPRARPSSRAAARARSPSHLFPFAL